MAQGEACEVQDRVRQVGCSVRRVESRENTWTKVMGRLIHCGAGAFSSLTFQSEAFFRGNDTDRQTETDTDRQTGLIAFVLSGKGTSSGTSGQHKGNILFPAVTFCLKKASG